MSGDPKEDYFSDGLTEQIITSLSMIPRLFVIARNSTFVYKGKAIKVQTVAEEQGVRYVLEGGVQKSQDRVRITVQLIDAIKGHHLWSERYDRELKDLFALQDEIVKQIMTAVQVKLTEGEYASAIAGSTSNLKALECYWRALEHSNRWSREDNAATRQWAERAIELDPNFAGAFALLGFTHFQEAVVFGGKSPAQSLKGAEECAQKALSINESTPLALSLMGGIRGRQGKSDEALEYNEKALAINPNDPRIMWNLALTLESIGRLDEAIALGQKILRISPYYPAMYLSYLASVYPAAGRYQETIQACELLLERSRKGEFNPLYAHLFLAEAYVGLGQLDKAKAEAEEVMKIDPKYSLEGHKRLTAYKDPAIGERRLAALRKAGLPDKPPLPLPDKPSIAVLPFVNMSDDKSQEFFSDGLTEEIINALAKVPQVFVIARNSSFVYKGKPVNVPQVSRELGVKYVLEGSVRRNGNQLRITAQLIDATTGNHLWAERYDRELKDIFAVQDEVTIRILASILGKTVMEEEYARVTSKRASNVEAYLKAVEANALTLRFNKDDIALARKKFEEAIALDPQWANAYSGLSYTYYFDSRFVQNPGESLKRAYEYAQKAISLDETQVYALNTLRLVYQSQKRYEEAIAAAEQAVKVAPGLADACAMLGQSLLFNGRDKEALVYLEKALRMNPFPETWYFMEIGNAHLISRNYEEAVSTFKKALSISPKNSFARGGLIVIYVEMGRMEEARVEAEEMIKIDPKFTTKGWEKRASWKDPKVIERFVEAWRKAGLERDVSMN
jgi:adenylate cyclase